MKILKREVKPIYLLLLVCFVCFAYLNFQMKVLDWDALAYVMNARTLVGTESYFEWHRPFLWPFTIALVGGSEMLARLLGVLFSVFSVYAIYLLGKEAFNEETGLFSAGLFAITPILLYWAPRMYTEIPVIGVSAMALYFLLKYTNNKEENKTDLFLFFTFCGLAYLTRYVGLLALFVGLIYLLIKGKITKRSIKNIVFGLLIFLIVVSPWLWFNYINTGDFFFSPRIAEAQMSRIEKTSITYYIERWGEIFTYPLTFLVLVSLFYYIKSLKLKDIKDVFKTFDKDNGYLLILGIFLAYLIYFHFFLNLKIVRYIIPCLMGWLILSGDGLYKLLTRIKLDKEKLKLVVIILVISIILSTYLLTPSFRIKNGFKDMNNYLDGEGNVASNIWPYITYYTDNTAKWIPGPYEELIEETQKYNIKYLVVLEGIVLEPDWAYAEFIDQKEEWVRIESFRTFTGTVVLYEYKYETSGSLQNEIDDPLSSKNFAKLRWI